MTRYYSLINIKSEHIIHNTYSLKSIGLFKRCLWRCRPRLRGSSSDVCSKSRDHPGANSVFCHKWCHLLVVLRSSIFDHKFFVISCPFILSMINHRFHLTKLGMEISHSNIFTII